jgi:hypothetical protein
MEQLDLNLLPMARRQGQDQTELPGLLIAIQPRRPARGRQSDKLILYLTIAGNAPIAPDQAKQLLEHLAQIYYKTQGSTTAAQRAVADELNEYLLARNQRGASSGRQGIGLLGIITIRNNQLHLAQCGMMHAFLLSTTGAKHIHEPLISGRGLGLGKSPQVHYSQADLQPNSTLILSPEPTPAWTLDILGSLYGQAPESMRRFLMSQAGQNLNALLLQAKTGAGKTFLLRPKTAQSMPQVSPKPVLGTEPLVQSTQEDELFRAPEALYPVAAEAEIAAEEPFIPFPLEIEDETSAGFEATTSPAAQEDQPITLPETRSRRARKAADSSATPSVGSKFSQGIARAGLGIRNFFNRMLPGEGFSTLPSSMMLLIAVAVPLVVVAIAAGVYFQRGRSGQYQANYAQAVQAAGYARTQSEPNQKLSAWQTVLDYLEKAEAYGVSAETQAIREEANLAFDELDLARRLDYQPAITSKLPDSALITHMFATTSELYLLNAEAGNVIRTVATNNGYQVDSLFQCAAGFPAGQTTQLIDIAPSSSSASVLALDVNASLLQCVPGQPPIFTPLTPPTQGWGKPNAIATNLGNTFILDVPKNTVWAYWNGQYGRSPEPFFTADFPMEDVIDLAVDKNDLYLLHKDGHTTLCSYSELSVSPSRCTDPLPYIDSRPGHENQVMEVEPPFTQFVATQPPDPSLFYLQPDGQVIYRFSLRLLTYYGQFRPKSGAAGASSISSKPATAFTLSPDGRIAFLGIGNQVLYAAMP